MALTHEMAHFYTHRGHDADGHLWDTDDFNRTQPHIVEGVAQFHTEICCHKARQASPLCRPDEAFQILIGRLPAAYTCFQGWLPRHQKRAEAVRDALVVVRTKSITDYSDFLLILEEAGKRLEGATPSLF